MACRVDLRRNLQLLVAIGPMLVLLPVIARSRLGGNAAYSAILTVFALGSLAGAFLASQLRARRPGVVALLALVPIAVAMWALATLGSVVPVAVAFFAAGVGLRTFSVLWVSALQRDVPSALLGRVMAFDRLGSMASMPIGFALTGPLVDAIGTRQVLLGGATVSLLTSLIPLLVPGVAELATPRPQEPPPGT